MRKANITYKVWVHIEEIVNDERFTDIDEPVSLGEFGSLTRAIELRDTVQELCDRFAELYTRED